MWRARGVRDGRIEDVLWVTGVLVVALTCLAYAREGSKDGDRALVVFASIAAVVFVAEAVLYVWWLW